MEKKTVTASMKAIKGVEKRSVTLRHSQCLQSTEDDFVAQEVAVALAYNGESHAVMMVSPIDLHDFAIGFSISERIVDCANDIRSIDVRHAKQGITIQLGIKHSLMIRLKGKRRQLSGRSGCGVCGITELAAAIPEINALPHSVLPNHRVVDEAVTTLKASQILQDQCGAVHCAGLFSAQGKLLAIREDVGRHNALDKLIGSQIMNPVQMNLEGNFIAMSSRASHELITKVAISGISTLVTISAATTLAIDLAQKTNVNLIGFIRDKRQIIYTQQTPAVSASY